MKKFRKSYVELQNRLKSMQKKLRVIDLENN